MYIFIYTYLYYEWCDREIEREIERERVPNNKARSTCGQFQQHARTAVLLSCIEEKSQEALATNNASHVNANDGTCGQCTVMWAATDKRDGHERRGVEWQPINRDPE